MTAVPRETIGIKLHYYNNEITTAPQTLPGKHEAHVEVSLGGGKSQLLFWRMENVASWLCCLDPGGRGAVLPLPPSTSSTLLLVAASKHGLPRLFENGGRCALDTVVLWWFRESAPPRILTAAHKVARNGGNPYWVTEAAGLCWLQPSRPPPPSGPCSEAPPPRLEAPPAPRSPLPHRGTTPHPAATPAPAVH